MPWVRIDEKAMDHPKVAGLPDGAFRLWVQGLAHCQKFLTDGEIDKVSLRGLRAYSPKRAQELVAARLWLSAELGVVVHDYLQWNDSRAHVLRVREQGRERIKKLRGNAACNAVTPREQSANDLRSYSGVVSGSSSQQGSSTERERGTGGTFPQNRALDAPVMPITLGQRAGDFIEWYRETHERIIGVAYMGHPRNDYDAALRLVAAFTDDKLQDATFVWLGMKDDFATGGTRTVPKFASRITKCMEIIKQRGIA